MLNVNEQNIMLMIESNPRERERETNAFVILTKINDFSSYILQIVIVNVSFYICQQCSASFHSSITLLDGLLLDDHEDSSATSDRIFVQLLNVDCIHFLLFDIIISVSAFFLSLSIVNL